MKVTIVGAGLAGCTAAAVLKKRHDVTVFERETCIGGLCRDADGPQECGPHAFHTSDEGVMRFVMQWATWMQYDLRVNVMTDPAGLDELPRRQGDDPAFRVYSEKAWGIRWEDLPQSIRDRVPEVCRDDRAGYHSGAFKAQPVRGYSAMMSRMLGGVDVVLGADAWEWKSYPADVVIYTGDVRHATGFTLPWITRRWTQVPSGKLPDGIALLHYATHRVPMLRAYDNARLNPFHRGPGITLEFRGGPEDVPCYPTPGVDRSILDAEIAHHRERRLFFCGRMGTYRYLDMDATIRNVLDTIKEAEL